MTFGLSPDRSPPPATSLVGREDDIAAVSDLIRRSGVRWVSLVGTAGVGKSRLAIAAGANLAGSFRSGAHFVSLAGTRDASSVLPTVAREIGFDNRHNLALRERLIDFLRPQEMLLILDGFQHLGDGVIAVAGLLDMCPGLSVLATNRTWSPASGETTYPVAPLDTLASTIAPSLDEIEQSTAVRLFCQRAATVSSQFELTEENCAAVLAICRQLDGLPLAIELAAARSDLLSTAAMANRLERHLPGGERGFRDQQDQLRTMQAAVGWSYDLLTPLEQSLLRRLSAFDGWFSSAAAETVPGRWTVRGVTESAQTAIDSLVKKSLLESTSNNGERSFRMHETVREFAQEILVKHGEESECES